MLKFNPNLSSEHKAQKECNDAQGKIFTWTKEHFSSKTRLQVLGVKGSVRKFKFLQQQVRDKPALGFSGSGPAKFRL